jgi:hypothetical protein
MGQVAYEAYCEKRNWRSILDEPLLGWEDQADAIREAWEAAAAAVAQTAPANPTPDEELGSLGAAPRSEVPGPLA